jgi:hypothetical protein
MLGIGLTGGLMVGALLAGESRCGLFDDCFAWPVVGMAVTGTLAVPLISLLANGLGRSAGSRGHHGGAFLGTLIGVAITGLSFAALPAARDYDRAIGTLGGVGVVVTSASTLIGYEISHARSRAVQVEGGVVPRKGGATASLIGVF